MHGDRHSSVSQYQLTIKVLYTDLYIPHMQRTAGMNLTLVLDTKQLVYSGRSTVHAETPSSRICDKRFFHCGPYINEQNFLTRASRPQSCSICSPNSQLLPPPLIIQVEEHCSPYILRVRLNAEQPKSSIDIAVAL